MKKIKKEEAIHIFTYNASWLRRENNISKKRMSEILGIGTKSLNKIEQGIMPPRLKVNVIYKMEDYFNIPAKNLLEMKLIE